MKPTAFTFMVIATFMLFSGLAPGTVTATELIVEKNPTDPTHYSSIQAAIDYAYSIVSTTTDSTVSYSVQVEPGTYTETITLKPGIPIRGRETATTILLGSGSSAVITAANVTNTSIANFTISTASVGISVSNNSSFTITNNIFNVGTSGTALTIQDSPSINVTNNVFYQNGTAISSNSDGIITNNIFYGNATAVVNPLTTFSKFSYNAFFASTSSDGQVGTVSTNVTSDPLFVDSANNDFHLQSGSPCINAGSQDVQYNNLTFYPNSRSDMGAYGGPSTDTIPFRISGVASSTSGSAQIYLQWKQNSSYLVSGYRVYYGTSSGAYDGTGATNGPSPINILSLETATTINGLTSTVPTPATPILNSTQPLNESLVLSWSAVTGATSYKVYYGTTSPPSTSIDVGDTTSYTLTGLTNGQLYYVAVSAVDQAKYYFAVTAFDSVGETSGPTVTPGVAHESAYSQEISVTLGSPVEGALSNILSDFPEMLSAYPALPEGTQGCFIATAAYGQYSAPEVQVLRAFRDRYLLTNSLGRAFVGWYYRCSPEAAAALNAHPALKPVIRAALLPAVGGAYLLTRAPLVVFIGLLMVFGCVVLYLMNRKRFSRFGGGR